MLKNSSVFCFFFKKKGQPPQCGPTKSFNNFSHYPRLLITLKIHVTARLMYFRFPENAVSSCSLYTCSPSAPSPSLLSQLSHGELVFILQYPFNHTPKSCQYPPPSN